MTRAAVSLVLFACTPVPSPQGPHQPTLAEVSPAGDAALDLVDRPSALAGATENTIGAPPDLAGAPGAFFLEIDGAELKSELDAAAARRLFPTYFNVLAGSTAVAVADLATLSVVGPPALAIAFAREGQLVELTPWMWSATNTAVAPDGSTATTILTVAWVDTGWLAEMRLTSSDGFYNNTLWFNGYLAEDGSLGWWDLYANDAVAGVVEWVVLEDGSYEAAIASLSGDTAGDVLAYLAVAGGDSEVSYWDAGLGYLSYVILHPDNAGEVALIDWNGNQPACWDTTWADAACP